MLTSLAFIFLVGLAAAAICQQLKLPRIIGMLITGIILGPYVLDLLDPSILSISSELRQMALIIILLKAGLSLDLSDLKKVGRPAVLMSFVPASFEILAFFLFAPHILGIKPIEAAVMGAVLAAVSPAIVVPRMVRLMVQNYGTDKSIPQLILAGASCDDIFVIVLFSTFSNITQGGNAHLMDFVNIPVSILFGIVLGGITGYLLSLFFETAYAHKHCVRNSMKVIIVLGISFLLMAINSIWVFMDLAAGRPTKPGKEEVEAYGMEPALEMEYAPRKIKLSEKAILVDTFPVRKYHIDTNNHVNNCQYVQMAMEVLREDMRIRQVRVEYKKSAVYGDVILPKIAEETSRTVVELCDMEERPYAVVEFVGEKK